MATWTCPKCGHVMMSEAEYRRHMQECGLGYRPKTCPSCKGSGRDVWGRWCQTCNGAGTVR
ncbi:hypothetical protein IIY24_02325 [Candidatus Saccharibacteria bacterium]|nr:hypothetical protein [Candidatus Saccharibacteria bacterium]